MDKVVDILHEVDDLEKVSTACRMAVSVIKRHKECIRNNNQAAEQFDETSVGNLFLRVFLSNFENLHILPLITEAMVQFIDCFPSSQKQFAEQGIYFNIMKLFKIHKLQCSAVDAHLLCALKLATALSENCPGNLHCCFDCGLIRLIPHCFKNYPSNKEVMLHCIHLLSILVFDDKDDENLTHFHDLWLNHCYVDTVDCVPISACVLGSMNKFLGDSCKLQLFGLQCLRAFASLEEGAEQIEEYGAMDSVLHANDVHADDVLVQAEIFRLLKTVVNKFSMLEVSSKADRLCAAFKQTLSKYLHNSQLLITICIALKSLLLTDIDLGCHLLANDLPSVLFHVLNYKYDCVLAHSDEYNDAAYSALLECFNLIVSDTHNDIRNEMLLSAVANGDCDLAVCLLHLGANINFVSESNITPLSVACDHEDESMMKRLVGLISSFQHAGLWKSRIENLTSCLNISSHNGDNHMVSCILWYLLDRDLNGIAEWSRCDINKLKSDALEMAFSSRRENALKTEGCIAVLQQTKGFKLSTQILESTNTIKQNQPDDSNLHDLLETRFCCFTESPYGVKKCPLQQLSMNYEESASMSTEDQPSSSKIHEIGALRELHDEKILSEYVCPRCSRLTAFRDLLKLSFDDETLLEERIHKNPVENCTCHVTFPPANITSVDTKEIQLAHNGLSSVWPFNELSRRVKARLFKTVNKLNLFDNHLTEFPISVAEIFKNLVEMNLSKNQLIHFPFDLMTQCPHLQILDLSDNCIQDRAASSNMPLSFKFVHDLKTLKLASNLHTVFPFWLLRLCPKLVHLNLRKNEVTTLLDPQTDFDGNLKATNLHHLEIAENRISMLPVKLFSLMPELHHLDLSHNNIELVEVADASFFTSSKLSYLDMSNNSLIKIPEIIPLLPKLQNLLLSRNNISNLAVPEVWRTKRLKQLELSHNCITDVSDLCDMISTHCSSSLKILDLSNNEIIELPKVIGDLKSLETLDVSDNQLQMLPNEMGHLTNLTRLSIVGNQLNLEDTIINDRAQNICSFLYARLKQSVPQNSVKLMLVGNPQAGKTTLLQSLMRSRRRTFSGVFGTDMIGDAKQTTLATVGVDVFEIKIAHENKSFTVSAWDFAGQEDFYATHPCFLSERAVYVAVYDASKGPRQLRTLKPWLTAIHARATHCPVLIVGSHADLLPRNRDEVITLLRNELQSMSKEEWFPRGASNSSMVAHEVLDVREYSSGMNNLKMVIAGVIAGSKVQGHPLVGSMVPYSYVQLTEILKKEAEKRSDFPVLSFNELAALARQQDELLSPHFESGSELMLAVRYLHQTGVLLHFDDPRSRLRDCFFIKPSWLCKLLAQVVTMKDNSSFKINPFINKDGILSKSLFVKNFASGQLGTAGLTSSFLPRLFRLLENFEVILWQGGDRYLVPSKLPLKKFRIQLPVPSQKLIRYFSMVYMPMGLWPRLIARLLAFAGKILHGYTTSHSTASSKPVDTKMWSEGLYFEWENQSDGTPFVLVQSGSHEYDTAGRKKSRHIEPALPECDFEKVEWNGDYNAKDGLEVVVPNNKSGQILLGQLVDHITGLVEEWYPGLMNLDDRGRSLFQQHSPCFECIRKSDSSTVNIFTFCINDLADSVLYNKLSKVSTEDTVYKVSVSRSGALLVHCPYHESEPLPIAQLAPEINLDDFDPDLRLDPNLLEFQATTRRMLGGGGCGAVYQALYDNKDVAIKTFHTFTSDQSYKMLRAELNVLAQHRHPSIISLKGFIPPAFSTPNLPLPLLALEYAKLGSLGKLLSNMCKLNVQARKSALSASVRHRISYEVADGLCFLHSQNIVYRDMKPDNILLASLDLSSPTIAKITDYGISVLASPSGIPGPSGSPGYSAPEVVTLKRGGKGRQPDLFPYSVKCDIYSFGLVLHELAVGKSPWLDYVYEQHTTGRNTSSSITQPDEIILKGILPSPISSYEGSMSWPYVQYIVDKCLRRNPEERPTSYQIATSLSNIQSACFRLSTSLQSSDPICARAYNHVTSSRTLQRCASLGHKTADSEIENSSSPVDIFYSGHTLYDESKTDESRSVMRVTIDTERGHVINDDVHMQLDEHTDITCMILVPVFAVPWRPMHVNKDAIIAGTQQGNLLVLSSGKCTTKSKLSCSITSLHYHQTYNTDNGKQNTGNCYILVGMANATILFYTNEQIFNQYDKSPLHTLSLRDISRNSSISTMISSGCFVYAVCGKHIVTLTVADSGRPSIQGAIQNKFQVKNFAMGCNHFYVAAAEGSFILTWSTRDVTRTHLDVRQALADPISKDVALSNVTVTSLFVNTGNPSLWVGLSSGHVIVYSEPNHEVLALLHRHSGPVHQIFNFKSEVTGVDVIVCLGGGFRPVSADLIEVEDDDMVLDSHHFSDLHLKSSSNPSLYITVWDADLAKKAVSLLTAVKARKNLL